MYLSSSEINIDPDIQLAHEHVGFAVGCTPSVKECKGTCESRDIYSRESYMVSPLGPVLGEQNYKFGL